MIMLEKELEKKLRDSIKARGGFCLKLVCPGASGVPDRLILLPRGRVAFAELKRPKGSRVAPLQVWWRQTLTRLGFRVFTIFTLDDLAVALCELGLHKKKEGQHGEV